MLFNVLCGVYAFVMNKKIYDFKWRVVYIDSPPPLTCLVQLLSNTMSDVIATLVAENSTLVAHAIAQSIEITALRRKLANQQQSADADKLDTFEVVKENLRKIIFPGMTCAQVLPTYAKKYGYKLEWKLYLSDKKNKFKHFLDACEMFEDRPNTVGDHPITLRSEGGGAGHVPLGGAEVHIAPTTPKASAPPSAPPLMPVRRHTTSRTSDGVEDSCVKKLTIVPEGMGWGDDDMSDKE